jgi:hypothetical protein
MKKIFNFFILSAFISLAIQSCQMKEDDIFDEDPATRQDNWMAEYRRVFNNNEYGWALYTDNPTYGRHPAVYAYAVKFDQTNCTFYNSMSTRNIPNANGLDSIVSQYSFKMDNGIVLSFDTYNTFFHYHADQSQYFSQDLQSDFEFCLDRFSANEDTIFGRGKTKQLPFFMVKMKLPAKEYQKKSDNVSNYAAYNCIMICEGDTMQARFLSGYNNLLVYFPDSVGGSDVEHMYSYGNLTNGIYLLENFKYKNTCIVEMNLDESTGEFKDINSDSKIGPRPFVNYLIEDKSDDPWFFGYSGLGSYTQTEWNKSKDLMKEKGIVNPNNQIYICLHPDGHGGVSLMFNEWYGSDEVTYPIEMKKVSNNELAFRWTGKESSGRAYSFYDNGYKYIVDAFAKTDSWTTYKITYKSGNAMSPVSFIFTDESNPDNSICFEQNFRYYHNSIWK